MAEAPEPHWVPLDHRVSLGGLKDDKIAIRDRYYNIGFINSSS